MAESPDLDKSMNTAHSPYPAHDGGGRDTSLERGLRILSAIAETGETNAKNLAAALGLPLSTTYRYLKTLRSFELVEEFGGRYLPSSRLSSWSGAATTRSHLLDVGNKFLRDLWIVKGSDCIL